MMVKPAPVIVAEFAVTGVVPVEVKVKDCVVAVFTVTLPKLRLPALTVNCGFAAVPVPLKATEAVLPLEELLVIAIWPLAVPVAVGSNWTWSVTDCVGFSVTGKLAATIVKPAPVMAAELTVTGDVPVDVRVNDCVVAVFTVTLPKLRLVALTVNCGFVAAVPVPLRVTAVVPPVDELLLIVIWPLAEPVAVGRNCTCSVTAWVGFSVTGRLPLTIVKPAPVIAAEFTVTGDVPIEVNVNDFVAEEFTVTLPKLNEVALNDNCGVVAAPVPLRDTVVVLPLTELLLIVRLPAADPVAVGANFTCSVRVWLGLNVAGRVPPTREKPVPETDAELTVTGAVPDDISVNDCVPEEFTVTLPKLNEPALALICGVAATAPVPNATICMTQGPE
jgi:hypothetical protein